MDSDVPFSKRLSRSSIKYKKFLPVVKVECEGGRVAVSRSVKCDRHGPPNRTDMEGNSSSSSSSSCRQYDGNWSDIVYRFMPPPSLLSPISFSKKEEVALFFRLPKSKDLW